MISIQQLVKTYRMGRARVQALDGVELEISDKSFVAVLGPSGSGKSTLLNLIGGLDRPTSGSIVVEGRALESLDEDELAEFRRETIGFVFQSFNLIPSMDARENVAFPLRFAGISRGQRLRGADAVILDVGLQDRWHHRPTELSGGQQQRVALARALINKPRNILAHEMTGNLDSATGAQILEMLWLTSTTRGARSWW